MKHKNGKLYGIGVGPGDPELIPLKSIRILKTIDVLFAASSSKNDYSYALEIARPHLGKNIQTIRLSFPMTADIEREKHAWRKNAETVIEHLNQGKDAAFITIGDPLTYSTYAYLVKEVKRLSPDTVINTIPGITNRWLSNIGLANIEVSGIHGLAARDKQYDLLADYFENHINTNDIAESIGVNL